MNSNQNEECPLCMEKLEADDLNFFPCNCKYQVCRFCWNHIITSENGLCPACRRPYNSEEPASFKPLSKDEMKQFKRKQKPKAHPSEDLRKDLIDKRVVQPNLLFVVNLPLTLTKDENLLKSCEYFGKYGVVLKVVFSPSINTATSSNNINFITSMSAGAHVSAYVTYRDRRSALVAILDITKHGMSGLRTIKASLGTTKYCSQFLKGSACVKKECMYLHQRGDEKASFTKEDMAAGKHSQYEENLIKNFLRDLDTSTLPEGHYLAPKPAPKPLLDCDDVESIDASSMLARLGVAESTLTEPATLPLEGSASSRRKSRDHSSPHRQTVTKGANGGRSQLPSKPVDSMPSVTSRLGVSAANQLSTYSDTVVKSNVTYKHMLAASTTTASPTMAYSSSPNQQSNNSSSILMPLIDSPPTQEMKTVSLIEQVVSHSDNANTSSANSPPTPACRRQSEDDSWLVDMVSDNLSHLNRMAIEEQNQQIPVSSAPSVVSGMPSTFCGPPPGFEEAIPLNSCSVANHYLDRSNSFHSQSSGSLTSLIDHNTASGYYSGVMTDPLLSSSQSYHSQPTMAENTDPLLLNQYDSKQYALYPPYSDPHGMVPFSSPGYQTTQSNMGVYYQEAAPVTSNGFNMSPPPASHQDHSTNSYSTFNNAKDLMELLKTILPVDATLRFASVFPPQQPEQNIPMSYMSDRVSVTGSSNSLERSYVTSWPVTSQPQYFPVSSSSSEPFYLNQHMVFSQPFYLPNKCAPVYHSGSMMEHEKGNFINDGLYGASTVILREPLYHMGRSDFS